jgi:uncharacterized protein YndB with AHSA1/START domain
MQPYGCSGPPQAPPITLKLDKDNVPIADPDQVVLESDPFRRLSYTWHSFTPEWAEAHDVSDNHLAKIAAEPRSRVTLDIEPQGDYVRLTVVHDGFEPGGAVLPGISEGWPLLMSSLKTFLETGDALSAGS